MVLVRTLVRLMCWAAGVVVSVLALYLLASVAGGVGLGLGLVGIVLLAVLAGTGR